MVQYSNITKTCHESEKRWYNTQTVPKSVTSQKKIVQYSNRTKTCHESEKDGTILKQNQNLSPVRKRWYSTQTEPKPVNSKKKMVQYSNRAKTAVTSQKKMVQFLNREKPATGQNTLTELCSQTGQNLLPVRRPNNTQTEQKVRKRWYNTQTVPKEPKPATSQKNMVQYSNTAKTCQQSEKDATVLKQSKTSHCQKKMVQYSNSAKICHQSEKRWYNTQTVPKPVTSQKKDGTILKQCQNLSPVRKKMVQYSNSTERAKTCHQSEKYGTILKHSQNLSTVRKRCYSTQTE